MTLKNRVQPSSKDEGGVSDAKKVIVRPNFSDDKDEEDEVFGADEDDEEPPRRRRRGEGIVHHPRSENCRGET